MKPQTYQNKMKKHEATFEKLWSKIVEDTNNFVEANPEKTMYSLQNVEHIADRIAIAGAWIHDRVNGIHRESKKSTVKKVRKALGYTIP